MIETQQRVNDRVLLIKIAMATNRILPWGVEVTAQCANHTLEYIKQKLSWACPQENLNLLRLNLVALLTKN